MLSLSSDRQAKLYDGYRSRMLHARPPMMKNLSVDRDRKGKVVI